MMKCLRPISLLLIIIGGINWLLVGVWHFNLVYYLFAKMPIVEKIVYVLVGLGAILCLPLLKKVWAESCKKK